MKPSRRFFLHAGLALLLLGEVAKTVMLIVEHRIPNAHDGFDYFGLQYYFANHAAVFGKVPLWIPFLTHGMAANWSYSVQASVFANVFGLFASWVPWMRGIDFVVVFHLGILLDKVVLVLGMWLWINRLYGSRTTAFFAASAASAFSVFAQPWWNFHLFHALPLVLWLVHCFLDQGKARFLFYAANVAAIQTLGNMPYALPFLTLVVILYFAAFALIRPDVICRHFADRRTLRRMAVALAAGAAVFVPYYLILVAGTETIVQNNTGRDAGNVVSLASFLVYGGQTHASKWLETLFGVTFRINNSLYTALAAPALGLVGLLAFGRREGPVATVFVFLVLFGLGGLVAKAAYHLWPGMHYFRHVGLTGATAVVFLIALAARGACLLFAEEGKHRRPVALALGLFFLCWAMTLWAISQGGNDVLGLAGLFHGRLDLDLKVTTLTEQGIRRTAFFAVLYAALFLAMGVAGKRLSGPRFALFCLLTYADATTFWHYETLQRTAALTSGQAPLTCFAPYPLPDRRSISLEANERFLLAWQSMNQVILYKWTIDAFLQADELGNTPWRVDYWLKSLDDLLRVYIDAPHYIELVDNVKGRHRIFERLLEFPAARAIAGVDRPKVRVFRKATRFTRFKDMLPVLTNSAWHGDTLLLLDPSARGDDLPDPSANDELTGQASVEHFEADLLRIRVRSASAGSQLFVSDAYHPLWRARVNGTPTKVMAAYGAYKAIALQPGENWIDLEYRNPVARACMFFFQTHAAVFLLGLTAVALRALLSISKCTKKPETGSASGSWANT